MTRHSWSERYPLDEHNTFRRCWSCGLMRITRHESQNGHDVHWIEWRRNGEKIESKNTPPCVSSPSIAADTPPSPAILPRGQSTGKPSSAVHSESSPLSRMSTEDSNA